MDKEASNRRHVQEWACSLRALRDQWPAVAVAVALSCLLATVGHVGTAEKIPIIDVTGLQKFAYVAKLHAVANVRN